MTINKLERVLWRIRANNPEATSYTNKELERAIMKEIGTDKVTYRRNRKALITLQYIKTYGKQRIKLTNRDLTE